MRFRLFGLGLLGVTAAVWMACSGDDNNTGTSNGGPGEPCLPNNQCLAGFDCVNNTCVSPSSGPSGDGGTLAVGNPKATATDCEPIGQAPQPLCPTPDAGDALCSAQQRFCCPGQGCASGDDACNAPQGHLECLATSQCLAVSSGHCCIGLPPGPDGGPGALGPRGACQAVSITLGTAGPTCSGGADTACDPHFSIELCQSQNDCPANAPCTPLELDFKGVDGTPYTKTVGYCQVPPPANDE